MPEFFITCDVPPIERRKQTICRTNQGGNPEVMTEQQVIQQYSTQQGTIDMDPDFISFLAYTFIFFAFVAGFKAGITR